MADAFLRLNGEMRLFLSGFQIQEDASNNQLVKNFDHLEALYGKEH